MCGFGITRYYCYSDEWEINSLWRDNYKMSDPVLGPEPWRGPYPKPLSQDSEKRQLLEIQEYKLNMLLKFNDYLLG